ncbi:MAG: thrombospondin type 3 repeat-containing protein [Candidatus Peribacteria bacterium]|nr:thrombospondin type 3 repeat-containing protein [Candidatus Peribacteria bacterium]
MNVRQTGSYVLSYTYVDRAGNTGNIVTRTVNVLAPDDDEDGDGYTNEEEINNGTDPESSVDKPSDAIAPVVTLNGS